LVPDFEMSEFSRQSLVYEKEHLLIAGTGKDSGYNFFKVAGVKGAGAPPKSPKSLLP
jgi:NADH-quinone oxidoreductase subunit I